MKKEINQLKVGAMLSYLTMAISFIIPMLYTPVMLRILGKAEYGLYSLSSSIINYLGLLTLGLGTAIVRYLMKYKVSGDKDMVERLFGLFIAIYAVIALITMICGVILSLGTNLFFSKGLTTDEIGKLKILIIIMSGGSAISLISAPFSSVIGCYERFVFQRIVRLILTIAVPIINLIILYMGYASVGMALIGVVSQGINLIVWAFYCKKILCVWPQFRSLPIEFLSSIFSFTGFVLLAMIADLLYWATDKILIGAAIGSVAVAIYNVGATFNSILQNLSQSITGVFGARVNTYVFENKSMRELTDLMIKVGRLQYLILSLVISGFIVFGQKFLIYWAGEGYEDAYTVALLTMIPLVIPLIENIAFTAIVAMKKHKFRAILYLILAIANVVGTYLLIPLIGIIGAALCTCIVYVVGHGFIMNWYYYRKIGIEIPRFWSEILKMSIVPGICVSVYKILSVFKLYNTTSLKGLLLEICVFTTVFVLFTCIFTLNDYEKQLFRGMLRITIRRE